MLSPLQPSLVDRLSFGRQRRGKLVNTNTMIKTDSNEPPASTLLSEAHRYAFNSLTAKQREVLDLLIKHMTSKEIARRLHISHHTVDQRILLARRKLGVSRRAQVAVRYRQLKATYGEPPIYEETVYEDSCVAPTAISLENGAANEAEHDLAINDPNRGNLDQSFTEQTRYRLVPEMFDGRYGTLMKLAAVAALALLMIFFVSAGLALFDQLSGIFGT